MTANSGVAPPDLTTAVGMVRLYLGDTDPTEIVGSPPMGTYLWYSDQEISALLTNTRNNARRVAVRILRNIAISQVLLLKKWTSADLAADGPAIADSLRLLADDLEAEANAEDAADGVNASFTIVPTGGRDRRADQLRHLDVPLYPWPDPFLTDADPLDVC